MSTFTFKMKKQIIAYKVKAINEILNEDYKVSYIAYYGGFKLYKELPSTAETNGKLGTHHRMNADTFIEYLSGIQAGLLYLPF